MAKLRGINTKMRGAVGEWRFARNGGVTVVAEKGDHKIVRTPANMKRRTSWANLINFWRSFNGELKPSFEHKKRGQSDFNLFMSKNLGKDTMKVYITKGMANANSVVIAPYLVSEGTLESIGVEVDRDGKVSSSIVLPNDFVIDASTTVQEFSMAVIQHNKSFQDGDAIVCFAALQRTDPVTGMPICTMNSDKVTLDTLDASGRKLLDVVSPVGFTARDGYLATATALEGGIAWIHTRKENGKVLVSTQYMMGDNSMLEDYVTPDAYKEALDSYGGYTKVDYLDPTQQG